MKWKFQINKVFQGRYKASTIQFTLVLSIIIAIFCASLLLLNAYTSKSVLKTIKSVESFDVLNNKLLYYLNTKNRSYDTPNNNFNVTEKQWGVLKIFRGTVTNQKIPLSKTLLVGSDYFRNNKLALSLNNARQLFTLSNKATVSGEVYVPQARVIEQQNLFDNNKMRAFKSEPTHNELDQNQINYLKALLSQTSSITDSVFDFYQYTNNTEVVHSYFNHQPILLYSKENIYLSNISIRGNIIIKSDARIIIDKSAQLDNCLLIAPEIEIKDKVQSSFQAFATKAIHVGKECRLAPYCFLGVIGNNDGHIILESSSIVFGGLMLYNTSNEFSVDSRILIQSTAQITGMVYSNTYVEHLGIIRGALFSNKLISYYKGINENQLSEGCINSSELPYYYPAPLIFGESNNYIIYEILNSEYALN